MKKKKRRPCSFDCFFMSVSIFKMEAKQHMIFDIETNFMSVILRNSEESNKITLPLYNVFKYEDLIIVKTKTILCGID